MKGLINQSMGEEEQELNGGPHNQQEEATETPEQQAAEAEAPHQGEQDEQDGQDEQDPGYQQALKFAMDALYQSGAAKKIAENLTRAQDIPATLADTAYNIVSITDEKTQGSTPDEMLILLASNILEEVCDIAESAGVEIKPSDVATALKTMILRYLGENGVDTTQLQQAMDQVNPEEFNKASAGEKN